jgi:TolB-like protein/Tfp pilus assembly protein PilF
MTGPSREAIQQALEKILACQAFQGSERMSRFLRFVVEHALRGDQAPLKEYLIGVNVFDRGEGFDPRTDTIVRVEARRLRSKLKEYYEAGGRDDRVIIELPRGGYAPAFRTRDQPGLDAGAKRHWKPVFAGAALLLAVLAVWRLAPTHRAGAANSIVVLPFANLSSDPENEYLSDGLTEEIISTLAAIPDMRVVARTSAFQFKGRNADIRKIGRDLSVKTALEGSVRREGQRIRVSAQLVSVSDGMHLWSKMYDRELANLLEIEEDITRAIVDALKVRLAAGKTRKAETTSIEAYELYLKGRYFWNKMTPADLKKSIASYEQAIALDPNYAAAYACLSDAYGLWINLEVEGPWEHSAQARRAAQKALELDGGSAEGHWAMGAVLAWADWDWSGSEREFRRALDLKPSLAYARGAYAAVCLGPLRRYQEAIRQLRQALEVDPLCVTYRMNLGQAYVYAARPDEAISELRAALELEPGNPLGGITLALAYLEKSSYPEALQVLQPIRDSAGEIPYYSGVLGYTYAKLGNRTEAERVLAQLKARFPGPWVPPVEVAGIYNGLGDREQALRWLERGCQQRSTMMLFIIDDPRFRNLYSDPRFQSVLGRMGLGR